MSAMRDHATAEREQDAAPGAPGGDQRVAEWSLRITIVLSRFLRFVSAHWLCGVNLCMGLYVGLPVLSPILYQNGYSHAGGLIQTLFRPFCHQRPERSFFLFGEKTTYSFRELTALGGEGLVPYRYVGAPGVGYKIAVCERDVAIYGTMFLAGLLFWFVRDRLRPLTARQFGLLILPMAVDGLGQLVGLWASTWVSRVVTGALFGLASIWLVYPFLHEGMRQVHQEMGETLAARKEAHGPHSG